MKAPQDAGFPAKRSGAPMCSSGASVGAADCASGAGQSCVILVVVRRSVGARPSGSLVFKL